jgi:hypothetical protein
MTTEFSARLFRVSSKSGAWTFVEVPKRHAPPVMHAWGRSTVIATVDGYQWKTSVWREKSGRTLLPVSKAARRAKGDGDRVRVRLEFSL